MTKMTKMTRELEAAETLLDLWADMPENQEAILVHALANGIDDEDRGPLTDLFGALDFEQVLTHLKNLTSDEF